MADSNVCKEKKILEENTLKKPLSPLPHLAEVNTGTGFAHLPETTKY